MEGFQCLQLIKELALSFTVSIPLARFTARDLILQKLLRRSNMYSFISSIRFHTARCFINDIRLIEVRPWVFQFWETSSNVVRSFFWQILLSTESWRISVGRYPFDKKREVVVGWCVPSVIQGKSGIVIRIPEQGSALKSSNLAPSKDFWRVRI